MTNKKVMLTLGTAAIVLGSVFAIPSAASAYRGDPTVEGPNCTGDIQQDMLKAYEENDYQTWANLMQGKGRVTEVINEGNFAQFAEAHRLTLEGKTDEANQVRAELGLGIGAGSNDNSGTGQMRRGR